MLPRGTESGLEYQFFFMVTTTMDSGDVHKQIPFKYAMGYPFDRPVYWEHIFHEIPNTYFHDAKIFFEQTHDLHEHYESSPYGIKQEDKHIPLYQVPIGQYAQVPIYKNVIKQYPVHHYVDIHH